MKRPADFAEALRAEIRLDAEVRRLKGLLLDFDPKTSAVAQGVEPDRIDAMDRDDGGVLAASLRSQAAVNLAQADRRAVREPATKAWRAEARRLSDKLQGDAPKRYASKKKRAAEIAKRLSAAGFAVKPGTIRNYLATLPS